jgi:hypothetical protein
MQVNYNYNWQECIGEAGGLVQRNLWSYLESEQLLPETKTYNSGSGIWFDNGRWGNNAYVEGNRNSITENTGSFGGYNIAFESPGIYPSGSYLYWPASYTGSPTPPTFEGQCIFIQWQSSTAFTESVSLFNRSGTPIFGVEEKSFWGGRNTTSGNSGEYLGWPAAANQTTQTNPLVDLTTQAGMYMGLLGTPDAGNGIMAYNTGVGMNVSGSQVICSPYSGPDSPGDPLYIKNNSFAGGFNFYVNNLQFGKQSTFPATGWVGADGSQITYGFNGFVKRILIYNSVLSANEIAQNWAYLKTLP